MSKITARGIIIQYSWCAGRESNPHAFWAVDFKSTLSTWFQHPRKFNFLIFTTRSGLKAMTIWIKYPQISQSIVLTVTINMIKLNWNGAT